MKKKFKNLYLHILLKVRTLLITINKKTQRGIYKISKITEKKPDGHFIALTPTSDCDNDNTYSDALSWALSDINITNIAITGSYGSGKSSFLKKFQKENTHFKYMNISLACFNDKKVQTENLELSILQQISYFVKHKAVKDSRIIRIKKYSNTKLFFFTSLFLIWFMSFFSIAFKYNGQFVDFKNFILKWKLISNNIDFFYLLAFLIFILGLVVIINKCIRKFSKISLTKLKLQGSEIELNKEQSQSVLNKYLDEILYFFEANKFDIVIIEDLDRFENNIEIFSKLREINFLLNKSQQINHRTVFIYAMKDGVISETNFERTKFFDFIIPIIPVINVSNSGDILLKRLEANKIEGISEIFIHDISLYISDMRLLNNIVNEFLIFKQKIKKHLNPEKLLAIVLYKNLMPEDFVDAHKNHGILFSIFNLKSELIKEKVDKIKADINEIDEKLAKTKETALKNLKELRSLYVFKILEQNPGTNQIEIDGELVDIINCTEDSWFEKLFNKKIRTHITITNNYGRVSSTFNDIDFKAIEKQVDDVPYKTRNEYILISFEKKESFLQKTKSELNLKLKDIENKTIEDLHLSKEDGHFNKIAKFPLIILLIRNGYINEDYYNYISFFYEGRLTKNDYDFLLSVKDFKKLPYDFSINKVQNIVKQLRPKEFEQEEVLNLFLVDYVFRYHKKFELQAQNIIYLLVENTETTFDFIEYYLENGTQQEKFFNSLCNEWADFWSYIEIEIEMNNNQLEKFLVLIVKYLSIETIKKINISNVFADHISNKMNLSSFLHENNLNEKAYAIFKVLKIKVHSFEDSNNFEFKKFIFENNYYSINYDNLKFFLNTFIETKDDPLEPNYSNISKMPGKKMFTYINESINNYVDQIFIPTEDLTDNESTYIEFLNNENLNLESKTSIIEQKQFIISDINEISDLKIKELTIKHSRLKPDWDNVFSYFEVKNFIIDGSLIDFFNKKRNFQELSQQECRKLNDDENETITKELSNQIVKNIHLTMEAYESLLNSIIYEYLSLDIDNFDSKKIKELIKQKKLSLTKENLISLENHVDLYVLLISLNKDKFVLKFSEFEIPLPKFEIVLENVSFTSLQQIVILNQFDFTLVNNHQFANKISEFCSKLNYSLQIENVKILMSHCTIIEYKVNIVNKFIKDNRLNQETITDLINSISSEYTELTKLRKRPKFSNNSYNIELFKTLKTINYISSFYSNKDDISVVNRY